MTSSHHDFRVLICGGGLAGLALAQAIRQNAPGKITAVVFEKTTPQTSSTIIQYPIHLTPEARDSLAHILSHESFDNLVKRTAERGVTHGGIEIVDQHWKHVFGIIRHLGDQPQFVLRWVLADILAEGVELHVGRTVSHYEESEGKVCLHFTDGHKEEGDLLVGADGVGSRIRAQLTPPLARLPIIPMVCMQAKLPYPTPLLDHLPSKGINMVIGALSYSIIAVPILPTTSSPQDPRSLKWLSQEEAGFVYMIFTCYAWDGWKTCTASDLKTHCVDLLERDGAHEALIHAFKEEIVEETLHAWQVISGDRGVGPERWKGMGTGRVVLIGDSAHAMPPFGGVAGSTSLTDAHQLTQSILSFLTTSSPSDSSVLRQHLDAFQQGMADRTRRLSDDATRRMWLSTKEGWRVWSRWLIMRIMDGSVGFALWVLSRRREGWS